jgi:protein-S-isoprenylcysteine O-methyltransferase Ste14
MSRIGVTALFAFFATASALATAAAVRDAVIEPTLEAWAVVGYSVLKLGVVVAFTFFVFLRQPAKRPSRDPVAFAACAIAVGSIVGLRGPTGSPVSLVLAGDVVALVSCLWLLAAVLALGKCFGVLPEARGLVTRGPYRIVRHPVYLGEFGACAGLVIAAPTAWNAAMAVAFVVSQAVRMRLEERALTEEFPEYATYAARTPRIVPWLGPRAQAG